MNRARQVGTAWETALVNYLSEWWPQVERRALSGAKDRGDTAGIPGVMIEAKAAKEYRLSEWIDEAVTQRGHAGALIGVVWAKRRGKTSPADGYVIMTGSQFVQLLRNAGF